MLAREYNEAVYKISFSNALKTRLQKIILRINDSNPSSSVFTLVYYLYPHVTGECPPASCRFLKVWCVHISS